MTWLFSSIIGLAMEFRSEKIPRNRLGMDSVIPRKKVVIPRHSEVYRKSQFRSSERNNQQRVFVPDMLRNGIPGWFLLRGMVCNGIPRVRFYFCSTVQNSQLFLLFGMIRNGIPRVFCFAEQPEFRRNKPIVSSIPSSAEEFFCRKLPTLLDNVASGMSTTPPSGSVLKAQQWENFY